MSAVHLARRRPPRRTSSPRPARALALAAALAAASLLVGGCAAGATAAGITVSSPSAGDLRGDELVTPIALSGAGAVPLTSTDGQQVTLSGLQTGKLMLVYFGYTHCPDVCPTTMADIAEGLRASPAAVQRATSVVFVSSDPQRDTVPVLRAWLHNFDAGLPAPFIGLTGQLPQIDAAARAVGVPLEPPTQHADGTITVDHGAQVLAFRDGTASVIWTTDTSPKDYAHDLAILVKGLA